MVDVNILDICFELDKVVFKVRERFYFELSEEEVILYFERVIEDILIVFVLVVIDKLYEWV